MTLLVAPCDNKAATFAVMNWHYSRSMPVGKAVKFGVWEDSRFIGTVIYGRGANPSLGKPFGLDQTEVCELVRVALTTHDHPVSQIVGHSLRQLQQVAGSGLRLVISFADPMQGHRGGIYQAGNWVYSGLCAPKTEFIAGGRMLKRRAYTGENYGSPRLPLPPGATRVKVPGKHRYLYPLDRAMRRQIAPLAQPYPSADEVSTGDAAPSRAEGQVQSLRSAPSQE
jgi:hypothetical protein